MTDPERLFAMMRPVMQAMGEATEDAEVYGMGFIMITKDEDGIPQMERVDPRLVIISPDVHS